MSTTGDSTRDWLLKKLLKASSNLTAQQVEINDLRREVLIARGEANQWRTLAGERTMEIASLQGPHGEMEALRDRVVDLSIHKHIEVWQQGDVYIEGADLNQDREQLDILSMSSANGKTVINVRARS